MEDLHTVIGKLATSLNIFITQEAHHKEISFEEEFKKFLDDNGIEYNPKYLFND